MMSPYQNHQGQLGRWYAWPLSADEARQWLLHIQQRQQTALRSGRACICCQIGLLVGHFWLARPIDEEYLHLRKKLRHHRRALALLELVMGQLLMSRQLKGARQHLARGFELAHGLLTSADYFLLVKRHRQLMHIPLSERASTAKDLPQLTAMAAVIERLESSQVSARSYPRSHGDF